MKFQKGLLSDTEPGKPSEPVKQQAANVPPPVAQPESAKLPLPSVVEGGHLFETLEEEKSGSRKYLKLFAIVVLVVIAAGLAIGYFMLPKVGDKVRVPTNVELAVRDHFLTKEKRTATDIEFYQCDGFFGAKVGVETRTDIANPLLKLDTYSARIARRGDAWEITASPIAEGERYTPCQ